ncbi:MAG: endosialidase [Lachnospiraceae bacterium]|nr:endosialidase [Lachnospiraceae bacterium]
MAVIDELIRKGDNGTLDFGNYMLESKTKLSDFEFEGDYYKVKTFREITKLEKNGLFVYESVEGTTVTGFKASDSKVSFHVEGLEDVQITLGLEPESTYDVKIDGKDYGAMKTNLSGKLVISVELDEGQVRSVEAAKA